MEISTILFGNGIGLALDENYFNLASAIHIIWNNINDEEKNVISLGNNTPPLSESELENHHQVLSATKILSKLKNENINWLQPVGDDFENIYKNFIFNVANHFYTFSGVLPIDFVLSLKDFIKRKNTIAHIATLNYDKLLYQALFDQGLLQGYQDQGLVDGFYNDTSGFHPEHMERRHYSFGWYMHLHGSPLFYTNEYGDIFKDLYHEITFDKNSDRDHIVLAPTKIKPSVISNSLLLDYYFDFFNQALNESNLLYLIGYSGSDIHINYLIKNFVKQRKKIQIIEWEGKSTFDERKEYWETLLSSNNLSKEVLIRLPNILDYKFL